MNPDASYGLQQTLEFLDQIVDLFLGSVLLIAGLLQDFGMAGNLHDSDVSFGLQKQVHLNAGGDPSFCCVGERLAVFIPGLATVVRLVDFVVLSCVFNHASLYKQDIGPV